MSFVCFRVTTFIAVFSLVFKKVIEILLYPHSIELRPPNNLNRYQDLISNSVKLSIDRYTFLQIQLIIKRLMGGIHSLNRQQLTNFPPVFSISVIVLYKL